MILAGRSIRASHRAEYALPYRCTRCAIEGTANVTGLGRGYGFSPFFLDNQGAREAAAARAVRDAGRDARLALALAPCPRCHKRDDDAVSSLWARAALMVAAPFLLFVVIGVCVGVGVREPLLFVILPLLGAGAAALFVPGLKRPYDGSTQRVVFGAAWQPLAARSPREAASAERLNAAAIAPAQWLTPLRVASLTILPPSILITLITDGFGALATLGAVLALVSLRRAPGQRFRPGLWVFAGVVPGLVPAAIELKILSSHVHDDASWSLLHACHRLAMLVVVPTIAVGVSAVFILIGARRALIAPTVEGAGRALATAAVWSAASTVVAAFMLLAFRKAAALVLVPIPLVWCSLSIVEAAVLIRRARTLGAASAGEAPYRGANDAVSTATPEHVAEATRLARRRLTRVVCALVAYACIVALGVYAPEVVGFIR